MPTRVRNVKNLPPPPWWSENIRELLIEQKLYDALKAASGGVVINIDGSITGTAGTTSGNYLDRLVAFGGPSGNLIQDQRLLWSSADASLQVLGRIGANVSAPTARLHGSAHTDAEHTAPLKLDAAVAGVLMATPERGAFEHELELYDAVPKVVTDPGHLWFTTPVAGTETRFDLLAGLAPGGGTVLAGTGTAPQVAFWSLPVGTLAGDPTFLWGAASSTLTLGVTLGSVVPGIEVGHAVAPTGIVMGQDGANLGGVFWVPGAPSYMDITSSAVLAIQPTGNVTTVGGNLGVRSAAQNATVTVGADFGTFYGVTVGHATQANLFVGEDTTHYGGLSWVQAGGLRHLGLGTNSASYELQVQGAGGVTTVGGRLGVNVAAPTSRVHAAAHTATAGTAPLQFSSFDGVITPGLTAAEDGIFEYVYHPGGGETWEHHLYFTAQGGNAVYARYDLLDPASLGGVINGTGASPQVAYWLDADTIAGNANFVYLGGKLGVGGAAPGSTVSSYGGLSVGATYAAIAAPTSGAIIEGNFGIGTTAPNVSGFNKALSIDPGPAANSAVEFLQNGTVRGSARMETNGDVGLRAQTGAVRLETIGAQPLYLRTNNADRVTVLSGGNVGIGNTSPNATLSIGADLGTFYGVTVGHAGANSCMFVGEDATHYGGMNWSYATDVLYLGSNAVGFPLVVQSNGGNTVVSGKLGIVQAAPTALLHIATGSSDLGHIRMDGLTTNPGTPTAGDVWYNTTQKSLRCEETLGTLGVVGLVYAATSVTTVTTVGSEQDLNTSCGLAAGGLTAGKSIRVRSGGYWETDKAASFVFRVYVGANAALTFTTNLAHEITGRWWVEGTVTVYTAGLGGAMRSSGLLAITGASTADGVVAESSYGTVALNTAINATVKCTVDIGFGGTAALVQEVFTVEVLD